MNTLEVAALSGLYAVSSFGKLAQPEAQRVSDVENYRLQLRGYDAQQGLEPLGGYANRFL